ncbi:MAG: tyrosine-type recombinase/integrase [Wolbachia endosymbiont of Tyrophagus putrescentiae]|nr:tyrosine-type recombinase/integrase [Wolbachia endosymbiont of Tyrophagus putrescentiae]
MEISNKNKVGIGSKNRKENFYITYFLDALAAERSFTWNTLESYSSDLYQLEKFLLEERDTTLIAADKSDLKEFVEKCLQREYKNTSASRKISAVKHFYKFLFNDGIIDFNPALPSDDAFKNPKVSRSLPKYLSTEEILYMVNTLKELANKSNKEVNSIRLCAILDVLYSSGMRISELINIKLNEVLKLVSDSNKNSQEYYIIIKGKSGRERQVFFSEDAVRSLKRYLHVRDHFIPTGKTSEWLFPGNRHQLPITRQRIGQLMKDLARKCNIDTAKVSPHVIRHSLATHLLDSGANIVLIQKVLGHANLSTTQIYTHVANEKLKNKVVESHPINQITSN